MCAYSCRPVNVIVTSIITSLKHSHSCMESHPVFMLMHIKQDKHVLPQVVHMHTCVCKHIHAQKEIKVHAYSKISKDFRSV